MYFIRLESSQTEQSQRKTKEKCREREGERNKTRKGFYFFESPFRVNRTNVYVKIYGQSILPEEIAIEAKCVCAV